MSSDNDVHVDGNCNCCTLYATSVISPIQDTIWKHLLLRIVSLKALDLIRMLLHLLSVSSCEALLLITVKTIFAKFKEILSTKSASEFYGNL